MDFTEFNFDDIFDTEDTGFHYQMYDSLPDYHLRNPLKDISKDIDCYVNKLKGLTKRKRDCLDALAKVYTSIIPGDHTRLIVDHEDLFHRDRFNHDLQEIINICRERVQADKCYNKIYPYTFYQQTFFNALQHMDARSSSVMRSCQQIIVTMNALSSRRKIPAELEGCKEGTIVFIKNSSDRMIAVTGSYIGIESEMNDVIINHECSTSEKIIEIYDGDWMRCVSDIATQRFILRVSCDFGHSINNIHYPSEDYINQVIDWGDSILREFKNDGFKLLKAYEALCAGYIMTLSDDIICDKIKFYRNTRNDLITENKKYIPHLQSLDGIFAQAESMHWLSQIYGLHRIWGHPTVNGGAGMQKVITIGRKNIVLSSTLPKILSQHFKTMFLKGFRKKYKCFPPIRDTTATGNVDFNRVLELIKNNDPSVIRELENDLSLTDAFELDKCYQLPETFNLSMVVADKSVSPTKSELIKNIKKRKTVMNAELRRGVLRWLNEKNVDPREFLKSVNRGEFPDDHKIIGLTPKERELNPVPRMFALMSHLMRVYVVITESMLSEHILPLFPQITMTDSLLELSKKIYSNVRDLQSNNRKKSKVFKRTICYSLDFEKWNGHMRMESTKHVFDDLGDLFGLHNLFTETYNIFKSSYYYLADGSYVPRFTIGREESLMIEEPYSFTDHKGGMEGLRQKGWTLFTVVGLDFILNRHNCTYQIMGMGDNQVLIVTFYTNFIDPAGNVTNEGIKDLKTKMNNLTSDLINTFGDLGLPLKPLETWTSESLFLYGKYPVFKGVPLTMDLKRIMRSFPFSNDDIMTAENILNTIAGSATSAAQNAPFVCVSYLMGLLMLSMAAHDLYIYHPLTGQGLGCALTKAFKTKNPSWKLKTKTASGEYTFEGKPLDPLLIKLLMILIPKSLGGYVTYHFPTFLMRGFPDPLTRDLYCVKSIITSENIDHLSLKEHIKNWSCPIYMPERNMRLLIEDILSLNLLKPVSPIASVRQSVSNFMSNPQYIKNYEFSELMSVKDGEIEDLIANFLCRGSSLHIRLLHDIYESTIIGYVDSIVSKVTKTATIQRLSMNKSKKDISKDLITIEENFYLYFVWRSNNRGEEWESDCETECARQMRIKSWGKYIKGVTVPFPLSFMERSDCYSERGLACNCREGFVSSHFSDNTRDRKEWEHNLGNGDPYMGSITKEKVTVQSGARIYTSEPLVRRPVQLLRTINWFVPQESHCASVIKSCLRAVSNIHPDQFMGVAEGTSGAEEHRYKDSSLTHGTLTMSNYLYSSRYHISTDNLYKYSRGGKNCDLHFQALLCAITELNNCYVSYNNATLRSINRVHHWKQYCCVCIRELDEKFEDLPESTVADLIPSRVTNRYLYVDQQRISYIEDYRPYSRVIRSYLGPEVYNSINEHQKYNIMIDAVSDFIVDDIVNSSETTNRNRLSMHSGEMLNRLIYLKVSISDVFSQVASKICLIAECKALKRAQDENKLLDEEKLWNAMEKILQNADLGSFLGLALFFSWSTMGYMESYSWYIPPSTIPVTLESACVSIKESLIAFLRLNKGVINRLSTVLIEETKDSGLSCKLIMIAKLKRISKSCSRCLTALKLFPSHQLASINSTIICGDGHNTLERYNLKIDVLRCTLDKLRKESSAYEFISESPGIYSQIKPMRYNSVTCIIDSARLRMAFDNVNEEYMLNANRATTILPDECFRYHIDDICKIQTQPTSASYKYLDILSYLSTLRDHPPATRIFVIGDGLGSTSEMIFRITRRYILVSTLLDSEAVISQTMPNLFGDYETNGTIDKTTMVNKVNNILKEEWTENWNFVSESYLEVWSDIELLGPERWKDRQLALKKILELNRWKRAVIKDYIYNKREFEFRISCILKYSTKYKLITSRLRQKGHPECWWLIYDVSGAQYGDHHMSTYIIYKPNIMSNAWDQYVTHMKIDPTSYDATVSEANKTLITGTKLNRMKNIVKNWCRSEAGSLIPNPGEDYTKILGRLQTSRRPAAARMFDGNPGLHLYKSSESDLRLKLLTVACSMLAHNIDRIKFLSETPYWQLSYKTSTGKITWWPYLKRTTSIVGPMISNDYIAVLSMHMKMCKLQFLTYDPEIYFDYSRGKRKILCFPVAKNMILRLLDKPQRWDKSQDSEEEE
ncbi:TPA_asm: L [Ilex alphacytorhabdovirus 1]|nr:TPA_asm: L [Ilex alphacytorhabdovirus 1]